MKTLGSVRSCLVLLAVSIFVGVPSARAGQPGVSILCYHHFEEKPLQGFSVKPADFEQQMAWLAANGFRVMKLSDIVDKLSGKDASPFPEKAVAITIDDGYKCAYERALPVLRKHKFPATLFIYPGYVGAKGDKMPWDAYKALAKDELFDVQCHSYTHPNFAQMARKLPADRYTREMHRELALSRKTLEEHLGKKVDLLAYPYGIYDEQIRDWASEAGYRAMFSVNGSPNPRSAKASSLSRVMVMFADGPKAFARKASALPMEIEIVRPRDGEIMPAGPYEVVARITDPDVSVTSVTGVSAAASGKIDAASGTLKLVARTSPRAGVHIVTLNGADKSGRGQRQATWLFRTK